MDAEFGDLRSRFHVSSVCLDFWISIATSRSAGVRESIMSKPSLMQRRRLRPTDPRDDLHGASPCQGPPRIGEPWDTDPIHRRSQLSWTLGWDKADQGARNLPILSKSADLYPVISFFRKGRNPGNCNAPPPVSGYQILDCNRSVLWVGRYEVSIIPGLRLHSLGEIWSSNRLLHLKGTNYFLATHRNYYSDPFKLVSIGILSGSRSVGCYLARSRLHRRLSRLISIAANHGIQRGWQG